MMIFGPVSYVLVLAGIAIVLLVARDNLHALWRRRPAARRAAIEARRRYEERLLSPDWARYEAHLQRPIPPAIRELYADHALIVSSGQLLRDNFYLSTFIPLDALSISDYEHFGIGAMPIADINGDILYLRPGPTEPDVLWLTYHDGGDTEQFALSLKDFLADLRRSETTSGD